VFAPISVILALLFFYPALPNGIRLVEFPAEGESAEILAGYGFGGLTALSSTNAARSLELAVYAAGGDIQFFEEIDRTGFRIKAPTWALPMFTDELTALFKEVPKEAGQPPRTNEDFRAKAEDEIRNALVGSSYEVPEYATYRAFVLISGPIPETLQPSLAAIPSRGAKERPEAPPNRLSAERTLRFKSDLPTGAVIFAVPSPGVYYREWYSLLLLDRLIHRVLALSPATALPLTLHSNYYRLELPVPAGQFPEPVEENLLQEIQRLQFTRADRMDLEAARREASSYLESKYVREWFESHGIPERHEEGLQWVQTMNADEMRVAARDLLIGNRVVATWAPKAKQTAVDVEDLNGGANRRPSPVPSGNALPRGEEMTLTISPFPEHKHSRQPGSLPERLASSVSIVASGTNAVFVSGGPLTQLDGEPDAEMLKRFQKYRADRILVLARPDSIDRARELWSSFKGNDSGEPGVPKGSVSTGDLPALVILKVMLDRKLIEAGWWRDVELRISASEGSDLQIRADAEKRVVILRWIKQIGAEKPPDTEFAWAREVAIHRFETLRGDLQALTWERDPQGTIQDLETIGAGHVSDVARIYF